MKGMSRYQTHISSDEILDYLHRYLQLKSFLQGYLVHCLADQLEMPELMQQKFPLSWQKDKLTSRQCTVILELFNVLRTKPPEKYSDANKSIIYQKCLLVNCNFCPKCFEDVHHLTLFSL